MLPAELVRVGGSCAVYFGTGNRPLRAGASLETPSHDHGGFLLFEVLCSVTIGLIGLSPWWSLLPGALNTFVSPCSLPKVIVIEIKTAYKGH